MRVLMIEDRDGASAPAEACLRAAGHQAVHCTGPGDYSRCRALEPGGVCPFDEGPIHAAVLALDAEGATTPLALLCAARRFVPAVSVPALPEPDADDGHLVAAVEAVAALAPPGHARAAHAALDEELARRGLGDVGTAVRVERDAGRLRVRATTTRPIPPQASHAAAVRMLAAVRRIDTTAPAIGVTVRSDEEADRTVTASG